MKLCVFLISLIIALMIPKSSQAELKVAVIDTGLDISDSRFTGVLCKEGHKDFTGTGLIDTDGHGTHIVGIIKKYAGSTANYCIIILKYFDTAQGGRENTQHEIEALQHAVEQHAVIINASYGGPTLEENEYLIIKEHPETLLIGAAGNENEEKRRYPGCMGLSNTRCVGALGHDGKRAPFSNYGRWVDTWQPGVDVISTYPKGKTHSLSGTSQATAIETGLEIKKRCNIKP